MLALVATTISFILRRGPFIARRTDGSCSMLHKMAEVRFSVSVKSLSFRESASCYSSSLPDFVSCTFIHPGKQFSELFIAAHGL